MTKGFPRSIAANYTLSSMPKSFDSLLPEKIEALQETLRSFSSVVIGYSGGVDSAVLCVAALQVLGAERVLACLAVGPSLPNRERIAAEAVAKAAGFPLLLYQATEMENADYRRNGADRCYHCKADLFLHLRRIADEKGFSHILYGANADDASDFRPGHRSAQENGARAPLAETGLSKNEIRSLARVWNLSCHDKPASPCLSSRIPYHQEVTAEKLARVERGEDVLFTFGFREFRLRNDGDAARIEVPLSDLERFADPGFLEKVTSELTQLGFKRVTLDSKGLRSGNLNAALSEKERFVAV
jgi:uncharacterized protein